MRETNEGKNVYSEIDKDALIDKLTDELPVLRAKLGIS